MRKNIDDSDLVLFQLLQENSEHAFAIIYKRYVSPLYSLAYKYLKNKEMAEDAVHYTFCKLWERRAFIDISVSLKNYLYTIVKNYILNEIRNNNFAIQKNYEIAQSASHYESDLAEQLEVRETEQMIQKTLDRLPEQKKQVCYYKIYDRLSNQEIADKMGLSVNTIKTHYSQSLKLLKVMLHRIAFLLFF